MYVRRLVACVLVPLVLAAPLACGRDGDAAPSPSPVESPAQPTSTRPPPATSTAPGTPTPPGTPAPTSTAVALPCAGIDLEVLPTRRPLVAITVDAGGDDRGVSPILAALADHEVRATFFVTGDWVRRYPSALRRIVAAGHVVGNHTTTHPHAPALPADDLAAELATTERIVERVAGTSTRPLFRFPFGDVDAASLAVVNHDGYCAVRWTVDTLGWKGTSGGQSAATVAARVLAALRPGEIVLMHAGANPDDGSTLDADALPTVIDRLLREGYGFTTVDAWVSAR